MATLVTLVLTNVANRSHLSVAISQKARGVAKMTATASILTNIATEEESVK